MVFIKLVRILAVIPAIWLIYRLLVPLGKTGSTPRATKANGSREPGRKFVRSTVIEQHDTKDGEGQS